MIMKGNANVTDEPEPEQGENQDQDENKIPEAKRVPVKTNLNGILEHLYLYNLRLSDLEKQNAYLLQRDKEVITQTIL